MSDLWASLHIIAARPDVQFRPDTYPSMSISAGNGRIDISLTGDTGQRHAFADRLRAVADAIDSWTEEQGRTARAEPDAEPVPA